jgi:hypothetical protein
MGIIDFYRTQLRIMWQWKSGPWALVWRFVLHVETLARRARHQQLAHQRRRRQHAALPLERRPRYCCSRSALSVIDALDAAHA